jgi:tetratricopeptide (TPR) repeat protein
MPKGGTSDIPHVQFTDHFIRVVDSAKAPTPSQTESLRLHCATCADGSQGPLAAAYVRYYEAVEANPAHLEAAQEASQTQPLPPLEAAKLRFYLGDVAGALPLAAAAAQNSQPAHEAVWTKLFYAEVLTAAGREEDAIAVLRPLQAAHPANLEVTLRLAERVLSVGYGQAAALQEGDALLSDAYRRQPQLARVLTNLAFVRMNQGRPAEAQTLLERCLALHPDHQPAKDNLRVVLQLLQK